MLARTGLRLYLWAMVPSVPTTPSLASPSGAARSALVWGGCGLGIVILLAALALWSHYGTTVFFEMIASGISACL